MVICALFLQNVWLYFSLHKNQYVQSISILFLLNYYYHNVNPYLKRMIQEKSIRTNTEQLTIPSTQIGNSFNPIEFFRNTQEWQY